MSVTDACAALLEGRRLWAPTPGVARIATLPELLHGARLVRSPAEADAVLAWGRKPSAERAEALARRHGLPLLRLEDGFLRSLALGPDAPPWSVVLDDEGIYYDASRPSRLERLIAAGVDAAQAARAEALRLAWCEARVSKYNLARDRDPASLVRPGDVLVVDQTAGDAAITHGGADASSFARMLEAALDEHPGARVLLKVHPDVLSGRKRGHFSPERLTPGAAARVVWLADPVHPPDLLQQVAAVYVVTSQMGFEALLWRRPLRCFGLPFYAGWGLSTDELPLPRRAPAGLEALVHAALVDYPRQVHPHGGARCTPEALVQAVGWLRQQRQKDPERVTAVGFSWWKRPILRRFMPGSQVQFQSARQPLAGGEHLVLWGRATPPAGGTPASVRRVEDGFLRSVGLGAEMRQPLSWVVDAQGLYYDATAPSQLEQWLQSGELPAALRARAAALRQRILAARLTKYNLAGRAWQRPAGDRPVLLVVGQVEADESLRWGAPGLRRNADLLRAARAERPDAWLVYKPHPDVVAGLRRAGDGEAQAQASADEVVVDVPIDLLIEQVDEVHVLTSLAGFEALLRQRRVVCWGAPFYAGWGLTEDRVALPRRQRRLDLDSLVAAALILYPRYVDPASGLPCPPERAIDALLAWRERPPEGRARRAARRWLLGWARRLRGR